MLLHVVGDLFDIGVVQRAHRAEWLDEKIAATIAVDGGEHADDVLVTCDLAFGGRERSAEIDDVLREVTEIEDAETRARRVDHRPPEDERLQDHGAAQRDDRASSPRQMPDARFRVDENNIGILLHEAVKKIPMALPEHAGMLLDDQPARQRQLPDDDVDERDLVVLGQEQGGNLRLEVQREQDEIAIDLIRPPEVAVEALAVAPQPK